LRNEQIVITVKASIDARDKGLRKLMKEYQTYKHEFLPLVQEAVRGVVKDRIVIMMSQQKWNVSQNLERYVVNLPLHPMAFHNQSAWIEKTPQGYHLLHLKVKGEKPRDEAVCYIRVPRKYWEHVDRVCGKDNTGLGQVEIIEDTKYGRFNAHLTLRLPKPEPYQTNSWVGIDVGWNHLAVSSFVSPERVSEVSFHGGDYKTQILQLKHLLKQKQRADRHVKTWKNRLQNVTKYAVGSIAKEITAKAEVGHAGVAMETLNFHSHTKRFLIPRYKLMVAVKNLCERKGIPFMLVNAQYTSQICNRCSHIAKGNRSGEIFKCLSCGYTCNADYNASVNIAREAISVGYTPTDKETEATCRGEGELSAPQVAANAAINTLQWSNR
jgi:transposase